MANVSSYLVDLDHSDFNPLPAVDLVNTDIPDAYRHLTSCACFLASDYRRGIGLERLKQLGRTLVISRLSSWSSTAYDL
jgi:hypothetical protein